MMWTCHLVNKLYKNFQMQIFKFIPEMVVLRRAARKTRMERIKNENIKEIVGVKGQLNIIDIIEKKKLQWYGHVQRMPEERIPKLIMKWVPLERRK